MHVRCRCCFTSIKVSADWITSCTDESNLGMIHADSHSPVANLQSECCLITAQSFSHSNKTILLVTHSNAVVWCVHLLLLSIFLAIHHNMAVYSCLMYGYRQLAVTHMSNMVLLYPWVWWYRDGTHHMALYICWQWPALNFMNSAQRKHNISAI